MTATVHVIGAGVAGLAAALRLARAGRQVKLYEAASHAGGRCRSMHDRNLDCLIDNGNHLVMSGNTATFAYLDEIGAQGEMVSAGAAAFPFLDLETGERWTVRPSRGPIPWWMLVPGRRVAGTSAAEYLSGLKLAWARPGATVADVLGGHGALYRRLWAPLATAALNTDPAEGAARLLWPVLAQTFLRGERFCRPYVADRGLSLALVDPAIATLAGLGVEIAFNRRARGLTIDGGDVRAIDFTGGGVELKPTDNVVLAVPPGAARALLPSLKVPAASRAIVNAHFRLDRAPVLAAGGRFLGLVGGTAQWLFLRDCVVSVTVSAADQLAQRGNQEIAARLWHDVARALDLDPGREPPYRIISERRATFAQTPDAVAARPGPRVGLANLVLAGDWTDTGLPATIESAIRSGQRAAVLI